MRRSMAVLLVSMSILLAASSHAQIRRPTLKPRAPRATVVVAPTKAVILESPALAYRNVLSKAGIPSAAAKADMDSFGKLPSGMQEVLLASFDQSYNARLSNVRILDKSKLVVAKRPDLTLLVIPSISSFSPPDAAAGEYVVIIGSGFLGGSQVYFNGSPVETLAWTWGGETLTTVLGFRLPASGLTKGSSYPVYVRYNNRNSITKNFTVVAPRGYRGVHGWKFANKGGPTIPWTVYRNFFGASTVEYGDGTHKPGAQIWYDTVYKNIGNGGNCFGMSIMSHRARYKWVTGLLHAGWWGSNWQSTVWDYNSNRSTDQVWQSIQEMQAVQVAEPAHSYIANLHDTMDNLEAWESAKDIIALPPNHAVAEGVYPGHCVVCYDTETSGSQRKFKLYDNNNPYSITESGGPDPDIGVTNTTSKTFSYRSYNKTLARDITVLLQSPSLPVNPVTYEGQASAANDTSYLVVDKPGQVVQITDEGGRQFYSNGQINRGANRIPGAVYFVPEGGLGPTPDSIPHIYTFLNSRSKTLTVQLSQPQPGAMTLVQKGLVTQVNTSGRTFDVQLQNLNTVNAKLRFTNPTAARLEEASVISQLGQDEERVFRVSRLTGLSSEPLELGLNAARSALLLSNTSGRDVDCRAELTLHRTGLHRTVGNIQLQIPGGRTGQLQPPSWNALGTQPLQLDLLRLNGVRDKTMRLDIR